MDTVMQSLKDSLKDDDQYFEGGLPEDFEVIEEGDWTHDHKYQSTTAVVKHAPSGRHFEVHQARSGSYHSDWYYCQPELGSEVKKVTETVTVEKWVAA